MNFETDYFFISINNYVYLSIDTIQIFATLRGKEKIHTCARDELRNLYEKA